jgi:hypothetical protein
VPNYFCVGCDLFLQGVGHFFRRVVKPFEFGLHTRCLTDCPNEPPACLEGEVRRPGHQGSHATVARPSMESRKLLLENTFAIKEVFSNNEATSWAVEELKHQGLKRFSNPSPPLHTSGWSKSFTLI